MKLDSLPIARKALAEIGARFPWLKLIEDRDVPVELSVTIPVQPGIKQEIWLCLQNYDELHFSVGHFCLGMRFVALLAVSRGPLNNIVVTDA